jgi:hypothetical protein
VPEQPKRIPVVALSFPALSTAITPTSLELGRSYFTQLYPCPPYRATRWDASRVYRVLFDARATNSSNLESKSFRMGDWFDFL